MNEISKTKKVKFILTSRQPLNFNLAQEEQTSHHKYQLASIHNIRVSGSTIDIAYVDVTDQQEVGLLISKIEIVF